MIDLRLRVRNVGKSDNFWDRPGSNPTWPAILLFQVWFCDIYEGTSTWDGSSMFIKAMIKTSTNFLSIHLGHVRKTSQFWELGSTQRIAAALVRTSLNSHSRIIRYWSCRRWLTWETNSRFDGHRSKPLTFFQCSFILERSWSIWSKLIFCSVNEIILIFGSCFIGDKD